MFARRVVVAIAVFALIAVLAAVGLDDADKVASVVSALCAILMLGLTFGQVTTTGPHRTDHSAAGAGAPNAMPGRPGQVSGTPDEPASGETVPGRSMAAPPAPVVSKPSAIRRRRGIVRIHFRQERVGGMTYYTGYRKCATRWCWTCIRQDYRLALRVSTAVVCLFAAVATAVTFHHVGALGL